MNKRTTTAKQSRSKVLFGLDQSYERLEHLELYLLELQVTGTTMESLIEETYGLYLQNRKPFTREVTASYAKALEELQHLRTNALAVQRELKLRQISYKKKYIRYRRLEMKRKGN